MPSDDEAGSDTSETRPKNAPPEVIMVTNTKDDETEKSEQAAKMSQKVTSSGSAEKERIEEESEVEKTEKKVKEQE